MNNIDYKLIVQAIPQGNENRLNIQGSNLFQSPTYHEKMTG